MAVELRTKPARSKRSFVGGRLLPAPPVSYEEFLNWADEDTLAEWVDGEIELMSPASAAHQDLSGFLAAILRAYAEDQDAGKVLAAPFQMKLDNVRRGREPDLLFVAKASSARLRQNFLEGPADLAVEIVSPESVLRDRGTKYGEYEAGGVREYWVLDPAARRADFFVLDDDGRFQRAQADGAGIYRSAVLAGFWVRVGWLWLDPLPTLRRVLTEWEQLQS